MEPSHPELCSLWDGNWSSPGGAPATSREDSGMGDTGTEGVVRHFRASVSISTTSSQERCLRLQRGQLGPSIGGLGRHVGVPQRTGEVQGVAGSPLGPQLF